jgi:hypothetical protein
LTDWKEGMPVTPQNAAAKFNNDKQWIINRFFGSNSDYEKVVISNKPI